MASGFHMSVTIAYVAEAIKAYQREGKPQEFVTRDGMPVSHDDALAHLRTMQDSGMEFVPCCDNCDATGACQGWDRPEA